MLLVKHVDHQTQFYKKKRDYSFFNVKLVVHGGQLPASKVDFKLLQASGLLLELKLIKGHFIVLYLLLINKTFFKSEYKI